MPTTLEILSSKLFTDGSQVLSVHIGRVMVMFPREIYMCFTTWFVVTRVMVGL